MLESLVDHLTLSAVMPFSSSRVTYTPRRLMVISVRFSLSTAPELGVATVPVPVPVPEVPEAGVSAASVGASVSGVAKLTTAGVSIRLSPQVITITVSPSPMAVTRPYSSTVTTFSSPEVNSTLSVVSSGEALTIRRQYCPTEVSVSILATRDKSVQGMVGSVTTAGSSVAMVSSLEPELLPSCGPVTMVSWGRLLSSPMFLGFQSFV